MTLRDVAQAAGVPVASIYHYFPDLEAIVAAVADRFGEELSATAEVALAGPSSSAVDLLAALVSAYRAFFAAHPGLRDLWFDRRTSSRVVDTHHAYRSRMAATLHRRMHEAAAGPDDALSYTMLFAIGTALWEMAFQLDGAGDARVIAEIRHRAEHLVRPRLNSPSPGPGGAPGVGSPAGTGSAMNTSVPPADASASLVTSLAPHRVDRRSWEIAPPSQARGRQRRDQIVAAATALVDAQGPRSADVALSGISQAAHVAPSSIYHYFDGLESVMTAVAAAYMDELLAVTDPVAALGVPGTDWDDVVSRTTTAQRDFFRSRPGRREHWFDRRASQQMQDLHLHFRSALSTRWREAARVLLGEAGQPLFHEMWVETTAALWDLAFALDEDGHPAVITEIEALGHEHGRRLRRESTVAP